MPCRRVEQMIGMSGIDIPPRSARAQIASAIHVVIQVARLSDGRRKLISLSEITGMEGDVITMQEIFRFRQTGVSPDGMVQGQFEATGIRPRFLDQVMAHGVTLSPDLFRPDSEFRSMSDIWLRALVLILRVRRGGARGRNGSCRRDRSAPAGEPGDQPAARDDRRRRVARRGDAACCAAAASNIPNGLPPMHRAARRSQFERTLMAAGVTMPTGRLMLMLLVAPVADLRRDHPVHGGRRRGARRRPDPAARDLLAGSIGTGIPMFFFQFRANRTRKKMQDQFPVALDVFVRGLRAGHPIAAALDLLTVEMPDPIGSQFGIVVDEVTYGADLRDALTAMADRWDLDDMRMFVVSLSVQSETGGNLAEILENLSQGDPRARVDDDEGPRLVERGPDDRGHADRPAGAGLHAAVHRQSRILPRRRRRSRVPARLCRAARSCMRSDSITIRRMVDLKV